ncbi:MAG: hypothetical protein M1834_004322 [Cirrosporium novae-zelandiae]|nr:MAG: hypothetical protein M1834_004322 [Cirrosporium novae-zelandiae]
MKTKVTKGPAKPSRATKAIKPLTNINHPGPGLVALSPALATGFPSVDSTGAMSAIQTNNKNAGISTTVTVDNKGKTMANMPAATMTMQQQVKGDVQAQLQQAQASLAPVQHQVASVPIHPVQHIHHLQHHLPSQIHQQPQLGLQLQPSPLKNATAATQHQHQNQHQPVAEDSRPSNQAQQGTPITQQLPPNHPIVQQQQQQQQNPASPQQAVQAHLQNTFQSPYVTPGVLPIQQSPYAQPQDAAYYASHPSPRSTHSAPGPYSQAETSDLMAAAQMQRPYPPIYHTPQSNSPASVASPQSHEHQNRLYAQPPPPQMPQQMYTYSQYQPMNTVHSSYGPPQTPQTHPSMTSQPLLMQQTAAQIPQQQPQMTNSPRMKIESSAAQRPPPGPLSATHATPTAPTAPSSNMHSSPQSGGNGVNPNAAPGPIPATTPLVVRQDNNGVQWIAFEYSRDRVKMEYTIRCDVESVNVETLSQDFKTENCVYPRACCPKDQYRGNRLVYETECNTVGWALAELNPCLRGKRGLIQRAVDSWRNSNQDPRLRSRRVRRMAKMNTRKTVAGNQPPNHMAGPAGPGSVGVPGGPPGMAPQASRAPGSMGMAGPQLHHHHAHPDGNAPSGGEEVSGMFHQM